MATVNDQDRFFSGQLEASTPKHLVGEGTIQRMLNGRFVEGALTNAIGFDEFEVTYNAVASTNRDGTKPFASPVTYQELLTNGDVQLVAPLDNFAGQFLVMVISGVLFRIDLEDCSAADITPKGACLPENSCTPISFLDNDGGTLGLGGYLVIFNYPNKSIFINDREVRLANDGNYEVPPSRLGVTAGSRLFIGSGENLMYASDPLGGAQPLAPLTFQETLDPNGTFTGQIFTIGSALDVERITAMCRLPRYLSAQQDFLAQQVLVSTRNRKYIVNASAPRDSWEQIQFISFAGSSDGVAGPQACTNIGDVLMYISTKGRLKTIGQDQQRDTGLAESFLDDPLGQYLCECEASYHHREWYEDLDHSRGIVKFDGDRLFATVYPVSAPATGRGGESFSSPTHRGLAVGSLDSTTRLGPTAQIAWESFYDWLNPIGLVTIQDDFYVVSKDCDTGRIQYFRQNNSKTDEHTTTIYTRGYFSDTPGMSKSMTEGSLYFRRLGGSIRVKISYLVDDGWVCGSDCVVTKKLHRFSFRDSRCKTDSWSIPLKITIEHNGCRFELESIRVKGEVHRQEK